MKIENLKSKIAAILIPHNESSDELRKDEVDTLDEATIIAEALGRLGFSPVFISCSSNLKDLAKKLNKLQPVFCFNLIEHLDGVGSLQHLVPSLLDSLKIPYSGAQTSGLLLTTDKVLSKRFLRHLGLATPDFFADGDFFYNSFSPHKFIIKPRTEDASIGIDDSAIVFVKTLEELGTLVLQAEKKLDCRCFAEKFIEGREFNISVLQNGKLFEVLPPAELVFQNYHSEKPKIVGYAAKWDEDSFEYKNVNRKQDFEASDLPILDKITSMAIECGTLFDLKGYYRVDFRTCEDKAYIIDINANPGLGKDTGFVAAAEKAGLCFDKMIERIVSSALLK